MIVSGTGRCGTVGLSGLLNSCGIPTTHEHWGWDGKPMEKLVDVSPLAAPILEQWNGPVALLVRHPLRVLASFDRLGFWGDPDCPFRAGRQGAFISQFFDFDDERPWDTAVRFWLDWCGMVEYRADRVIRIEDVSSDDVEWVADTVGVPLPCDVGRVLARWPRTTNTKGPVTPIGWDTLAGADRFPELVDTADRYGYDTTGAH